MNGLLRQIGEQHVTGFFLVLARVGPLFIVAPLFSSKMLPPRARGVCAVALAVGLFGVSEIIVNLAQPEDSRTVH